MKCASCHDSFINELKLSEAYGMAAIISDKPLEIHRCDKPTGEIAAAAFLFPELGQVDAGATKEERLRQTAELLTSKSNGRFARTIVNRIWERLMGRGIVHPVDIMGNKGWNEPLLDYLASHFVENGYDLKLTIELIVSSDTYALQSSPDDVLTESDFVFRGPARKRMTAEQFLDSVWRITGTTPKKAAFSNRHRRRT